MSLHHIETEAVGRGRGRARRALATAVVSSFAIGALANVAATAAFAAPLSTIDIGGPTGSGMFGKKVLVLANGNFVVTDPLYDSPTATDVGAVYLYNGATHALISTLTGTQDFDQIGSKGVLEVGSSDLVVLSPSWSNDTEQAAGAVTWIDGTAGLDGEVSPSNSVVGVNTFDFVGTAATVLKNGNVVLTTQTWDNGNFADAGAVTLIDGASGAVGPVDATNSLVGSKNGDQIGLGGIVELTNGNFLVRSTLWDNGAAKDAGALTFVNGVTGLTGPVNAANSLVGSTTGDNIGARVTALSNGNYVASSELWNRGAIVDAGASTWGNGVTGTVGAVTTANSLVGAATSDFVGIGGVTALTNGNYVVNSPSAAIGAATAGAATWGNGATGTTGVVAAANSTVGAAAGAQASKGGTLALSNGNYVVISPLADVGGTDSGAATWGNGATGSTGVVTAASSLVGGFAGDQIGSAAVALPNGNYVVGGGHWQSNRGSATWGNGAAGTIGTVSAANSLVGTAPGEQIGQALVGLSTGNYVVVSPNWNNAISAASAAGAVTLANGSSGLVGNVTAANSMIGTSTNDMVGGGGVVALANGTYAVASPKWDGTATDTGAVTVIDPLVSSTGAVSAANSRVGSKANDQLGSVISTGTAVASGVFAFASPLVDTASADVGAVTIIGYGTPLGAESTANSVFGSAANGGAGINLGSRLTTSGHILVGRPTDNTVTLAIVDSTPPAFATTPPDVTVATAPGGSSAVVTFPTPVATDDHSVPADVCNPASGTAFAVGNTAVTCTATDGVGNAATTMFQVIVTATPPPDTTPPVLATLPDLRKTVPVGTPFAVVSYPTPAATDDSGTAVVVCNPASGAFFPVGDTTVTCTATDPSHNTSTTAFHVIVAVGEGPDVIPPQFTSTPVDVNVTVPFGTTEVAVTYTTPTATDDRPGLPGVICSPAGVFPVGSTTVTCTASDAAGNTATVTFHVIVTALPKVENSDYVPLSPARLADTRDGFTTVDGVLAGGGQRAAGTTLVLPVAGRGGVAADAHAVALNVTAVDPSGSGYVTVFPCGSPQPLASNLNFTQGAIVPNSVISKIGANGSVCIYVFAATQLVVDVNGFFPTTTSYVSINPARVHETRQALTTIDGLEQNGGKSGAGTVTAVQIRGRAGVPADAWSVVLNVTITEPDGDGYATVFPCGTPRPLASNLNAFTGDTIANLVISNMGADGTVCIFTQAKTHLVVDVDGWFPTSSRFTGVQPARLLDTRPGVKTVDGQGAGIGIRAAGTVTPVKVTGRGGVPANATAVILNATVDGGTAAGYLTVYPCGIAPPLASNLNFVAGDTVPNSVIARLGDDGTVCVFNSQGTHVIVDVDGYFTS